MSKASVNENVKKSGTGARTLSGKVISANMDKTIVVQIERVEKHPMYKKYIKRRSTKVYAHDEKNTCHIGDVVLVQECRPLSKTKSWMLLEVLEKAA